jgi:tetratricopeptide (TPR) repeat protein
MNKYIIILIFLIAEFSCNNVGNNAPRISYKTSDINENYELIKSKMDTAYNKNEYQEALYFLQQLIQFDSTNGEYYYKIGYCESGLLNSQKSTNAYNKAIKYNYRVVDATFNIGTNYLTVDDSLARIYFERCLAIDSNYESAKIQLMVIAQRNKKK